ncbi:BspA family leucine-rich repeat surface protein [Enterococcus pernyi]|uniref:BspA family leucine-rich repeat surface protein n=1 Tax=Enterococcus pernyi TaxID=590158 RepID=UPI000AC233F2|nr:BspA family leucine-rich repeat surface protein [Enterococcus pernyi]
MKIKKALVLISTCLLCFPLLFSPVMATNVPVFAIDNSVELTKEAELLDPLTYTHNYSSSSDNHEVTATSEYPEKQEESEKNESEEVSNRATEYRLELVASPPAGGNPRRTDSAGSNVVWLPVGGNLGNMRAFPNPGYQFLHWEVASGPIFIFNPNSEDLSVNQREAGNSVIRAVFEPVQGGNVTVKHEDEAGNSLADPSVLTGLVDQTYTTEALSISGWQLSKIPENASGTFGVEEQTVVYTYEPEQNLWGTVPWSYEEGTETITLYGGEAGARGDAPWKIYSSVKQIIVEDQVILPSNSTQLFWALPNLESIDNAGRFDTSNVTNMHNMFGGTNNIKTLDLSNWDTSKVTDMAFMFNSNRNLETLNISNWNTSNVTNMRAMFQNTESLTVIDVSNWDTSSVTLMRYMFFGNRNLETLNVSNWNTSNVTDMEAMFRNAESLQVIDVSSWDTSSVTSMRYMFSGVRNLETLNVSNWVTLNVTDVEGMFQNAESLQVIDVSNWDTSSVTSMRYMFSGARNLETLNVSNWVTLNVTDMEAMFQNAESLQMIDVSNWNTSNVTNMSWMFNGARNLENLNVSNWNTSNVTSMRAMFQNAESLTVIDVSNWDTSSVTLMRYMFFGNRNLETLNVSNWNTSNVTDMTSMFAGSNRLVMLNLSNWNTTNVSVATSMFSNTTNLSDLRLGTNSRFDHLASPPTMPTITSSDNYTGNWVYYLNQANTIPEAYIASSSANFWREYDGSNPGTYQWQKKGSVAVHYRDINDQEIIASEIITGGIREPFQIEEKAIEGYTLQEIPDNTSGRFTEVEQAVIFRYMKNTVDPVDPLNPEIEVYPENKPDLPEDQGLLSIDFISSFNFGSQAISIHEQTYYAQPQRLLNEDGAVNENEVRPNYVQISDRRPESERNGWELAVTQQEQFKGKENQVLNGASITLLNQQVVTAQGGTAPELQSVHPLIPGNRQRLLKAQGSEGMGTWIYRFGDADTAEESVTLNVPKGANPEATTYSTKLTWELSRVPDN